MVIEENMLVRVDEGEKYGGDGGEDNDSSGRNDSDDGNDGNVRRGKNDVDSRGGRGEGVGWVGEWKDLCVNNKT